MAGNFTYSFCQWAILVALAKLGSSAMLGQYSLGLSITAPLMMFFNLALRPVLATDMRNEYLFQDYLTLRIIAVVVFFIALIGILIASNYPIHVCAIIALIGLAKMVESISDLFWGFMQKHERFDLIARSMIIKGLLSVLFLSMGLYLFGALIWGILGVIFSYFIILVVIDLPSYVRFHPPTQTPHRDRFDSLFNLKEIYHLTRLTIPLGFVQMLGSLITNVPRYLIEQYWGFTAMGIYTAIASFNAIGAQLVNALGQSTVPRLAKYYADGDITRFKSLLIRLILIGASLGLGTVVFALAAGREFLKLVYSEEYSQYNTIFILFAVVSGVTYITCFLGYCATSARTFRVQFFNYLTVFAITIVLGYTLIPKNGLRGAAVVVLVSNLIHMCIYFLITYTIIQKKIHPKSSVTR